MAKKYKQRKGRIWFDGEELSFRALKAQLLMYSRAKEAISCEPWSYVRLEWPDALRPIMPVGLEARGFARCCRLDTFDRVRGLSMAHSRAVSSMAKAIWDSRQSIS